MTQLWCVSSASFSRMSCSETCVKMRSGFFALVSISFMPEWYSHAPSGN